MKKGHKKTGQKVHFKENSIELSNKIDNKTKENLIKKNETEEEDIFSTIKHQIKEEFSLGKLERIEWAKEHASSNRPLNKIKEFTKSTKFCNC